MSSILTNMSAMSAVQSLAATQKSLASVQNEISTGLAVSSAEDNAAYYSIAQTMRTSVSNLSAVSSSLNLGSSVVSTATAATGQVTSILQSISADLVTAKSNVGNATTQSYLNTAITALNQQLGSIVSSASFNGTNLLDGSSGSSVSFVSGITGSGANTSISSLTIDTSGTNLNGAVYSGVDTSINAALTAASTLVQDQTAKSAAQATNADAISANSSAASALTSAVAALTYTQLGGGAAVTTSNSSAQFQAAFGVDATMTSGGLVQNIDANSVAGALLGTGTGVQAQLSIVSTAPGSTGSTITSYTNGTSGGGTLGTLYGSSATNSTVAGGGAVGSTDQIYTAAAAAVTTQTAAAANAKSTLNTTQLSTYNAVTNGALYTVGQISLGSSTTSAQIDAFIKQVGTAVTAVNTAAEQLGAASSQIDLQTTYISSLSNSLTSGVGSLVDADMNEASTRLSALQTQQQLGVQALSVANQNSQLILKLFQ